MTPWLVPHAGRLAVLAGLPASARPACLSAWAREGRVRTASGQTLSFVATESGETPVAAAHGVSGAALAAHLSAVAYESGIHQTGQVPTRLHGEGGRHDLFNALAWLAWPLSKARLNALHVQAIAARGAQAVGRGTLRDVLTLIDENAALWLCEDDSLTAALRAFDWNTLFVTRRRDMQERVQVRVFGHALLHKLDVPYKAVTAHAWPLSLPPGASDAQVDAALAASFESGDRLSARMLCPLPVMGLPGWCEANRDPAFYADVSVFRPGRSRRSPQPPDPTICSEP